MAEDTGNTVVSNTVVSVDRIINAPASALFAVVADATRHPEIDGSGQLVKAKDGAPHQLTLGSTFGMSMKMGVPYSMSNTVVDFEQDRRIAWRTVQAGPARPLPRRACLALRVRAGRGRHKGDRVLGHLR